MVVIDFTDKQKLSAKRFAERTFTSCKSNTKDNDDFLSELYNYFHLDRLNDYGVEDAILQGKRMRLMDEIYDDHSKMNCAETGVNLLLIASSIFEERDFRLLKYSRGPSNHFALLEFDNENKPKIIDPLFGLNGRVELSNKKIKYFQSEPLASLSSDFSEEEKVEAIEGDYSILSKEEAIRHVKYLNSPLGFFDYYKFGQKLKNFKTKNKLVEYLALIKDDKLILRANFKDITPGSLTIDKIISETLEVNARYLHEDVDWVHPIHIVCMESLNDISLYPCNDLYPFNMNSAEIFASEDTGKTACMVIDLNETLRISDTLIYLSTTPAELKHKNNEFHLDSLEIAIESLRVTQLMLSSLLKYNSDNAIEDFGLFDKRDELEENLNRKRSFLEYAYSLGPEDRNYFFNAVYSNHHEDPAKSISDLKNISAEMLKSEAKKYMNAMERRFKPEIDEFFNSPVVTKLKEQYREVLEVKKLVEED